MPDAPEFDSIVGPLQSLISRFVKKQIDSDTFKRELPGALAAYETATGKPRSPKLHALTEKLFFSELRERGREALRELANQSTRAWIERHLIAQLDGPYSDFSFFRADGQSLFGRCARLHETPIADGGFLYSSLAGVTKPLPFDYRALLATLREVGGHEPAAWAHCVEVDGAIADIFSVYNWGDVYDQVHHLQEFEFPRTPEHRGGYVLLLPESRRWMLVNADEQTFTIDLHGSEAFVAEVLKRIGVAPVWYTEGPAR